MIRVIARATAPHFPTLVPTLAPLLAVANGGAFSVRYADGQVLIEQTSFTGVDTAAVDAAVAAAPVWTAALDVKAQIDDLPIVLRAGFLAMLDLVNVERGRHSVGNVTPATFLTQTKAKADTL